MDIQAKCSNIVDEILNVMMEAEQTCKYRWPHETVVLLTVFSFLSKMIFASNVDNDTKDD